MRYSIKTLHQTEFSNFSKEICKMCLTFHKGIFSQSLTKDHELALKKRQADVNALSRQLDHVISFTKWATESHSGTALLYCKRLVSVRHQQDCQHIITCCLLF